MKILLSPTKTMNLKDEYYKDFTDARYLKESKQIRGTIGKYNRDQLKSLFKVSDKLSDKIYEYYHSNKIKKSALSMYQGQAFKAMEVHEWSEEELNYAKEHLIILSALYGVLRPSDLISPYRLDFFTNLEVNLYDFWSERLNFNDDYYINLASQEFSKLVPSHKLINIHFIEEDGKIKSTYAKTARGNMAKLIIKSRIDRIEDLKSIHVNNYYYDEKKSDKYNLYYVKKTQ